MTDPLLTTKEIAAILRKHPSYVYAMKRRGFRMVARVATITQAMTWLRENPEPRSNKRKRGL